MTSLSSIAILPGETAQPIHADDQLIPLPRPHVPLVCNTMWALTDFTEANGATRVIPGSHLSADAPELGATYASEAAVMKRGSVLVFGRCGSRPYREPQPGGGPAGPSGSAPPRTS